MLLTNEKCPEWVKSRIHHVIASGIKGKHFDYFIHSISLDDKEIKNNSFEVYIVSDVEVINFKATLDSIYVYKYKMENIDRIIKKIYTPTKDKPDQEDVICEAMDLVFKDGTNLSIKAPTYKGENNPEKYRIFIMHF
ncbi:hypothetical protein M7775_15500 [Sporomusa sphaeroides DSM 2875]|uniref:hypothetical protein n=1 Tax=Sporomusa sphaeroides TaxID=47679 RepID=UPI00202FB729|nr:hypothetical protein [Sporomusa sphaeroides]MCM0759963.1 hypothetical protein [Sporomusa sphaeroides DSM 2875]